MNANDETRQTESTIVRAGPQLDDCFVVGEPGVDQELLFEIARTMNFAAAVHGAIRIHPGGRIPTHLWFGNLQDLSRAGGPIPQPICDANGNLEAVLLVPNLEALGAGYASGDDPAFDELVEGIRIDAGRIVLSTLAEWDFIELVGH